MTINNDSYSWYYLPYSAILIISRMSNSDETTPANHEQKNDAYGEAPKKRRIKTGEIDRDHNCLCGKSYLSYPALYTHIKNKHGGQTISGMVKKSKEGTTKQINNPIVVPPYIPAPVIPTPSVIRESEVVKPEQQVSSALTDIINFLKQIATEPTMENSEFRDLTEQFG